MTGKIRSQIQNFRPRSAETGSQRGSSLRTAADVAEQLSEVVRRAAWPIDPGELISQQIRRAARRLGLHPNLAKRLWYREQRVIPAHLALNLLDFDRRAAEVRARLDALNADLDALRDT
jgi:hypothetical protein